MSPSNVTGHEWGHEDLRRAVDAAGVAMWSWNVDTDSLAMDPRGYDLWDVSPHQALSFEKLSEKIHPADRDRVREAFAATRSATGRYEIDFRTLVGEEVRWISARGQGGDVGIKDRAMTGVFMDITGRKQAEEGNELLAGEMSHRVRNLLAIAAGLTKITGRSSTDVNDMSRQLTHRLMALGRAHDLVRPLPGGQGKAALLGDLMTVLLAPYDDDGAFAGRIRVAVPRMGIGEAAATSLALVVHELATNSLKYGALSVESGTLDITGVLAGEDIRIDWKEHDGTDQASGAQTGPGTNPTRTSDGYGSNLIRQTVKSQLGGTISYDWNDAGVVVSLVCAVSRLSQ
ncbi:sensor histidine kinase [Pseudotabrizicola alkalilacus]|uniref:histidine kinase n=1 Tax=Pseudotabrizicola alkalilacus TaxID=2305252 RepID=A0A411Z035_9RHOB|nr:sensor histidine kinase [Pseudotabrizicola alkalilacus]RGP36433.1 histidine kinase [Pseudotabrizicola alkalilacus]